MHCFPKLLSPFFAQLFFSCREAFCSSTHTHMMQPIPSSITVFKMCEGRLELKTSEISWLWMWLVPPPPVKQRSHGLRASPQTHMLVPGVIALSPEQQTILTLTQKVDVGVKIA